MNKGLNFQLSATNTAQGAFNSFNKGLQSVNQAANTNRGLLRSMNVGMNGNRRAVQQLGFQMSDFAVQVAGGQSAMLAFVQQGGQILQFFGPFGAVMAALLAVFGSLFIAMTKTGTAIDSLYPYLGVLENQFRGIVDAIKAVIGIAGQMGKWIVHNLDLIIITALVASGVFALTWVRSMALATAATFTLSGALAFLTAALIKTGIGALIILVGYLIERFLTLARGVGGFGEALKLVYDLGKAVFLGIGKEAEGLWLSLVAGANRFQAAFLFAVSSSLSAFYEMTWAVAEGLNDLFGTDLTGATGMVNGINQIRFASLDAEDAATAAAKNAEMAFAKAGEGIIAAWAPIRDGLLAGETVLPGLKPGAVPGTGEGAGGGAVEAARADAEKIRTVFDDMQKSISDSMLSSFKALTQGTKSFSEAAFDMLSQVGNRIIDILMTPVFNNLAGGIAGGLGKIIPGLGGAMALPSFDGGGYTWDGPRAGGLDGRGGRMALLHPNETVVDHTKGKGTGGNITVHMTVNAKDAESFRKSRSQIEADLARIARAGNRGN
jgi:hypothetical protein